MRRSPNVSLGTGLALAAGLLGYTLGAASPGWAQAAAGLVFAGIVGEITRRAYVTRTGPLPAQPPEPMRPTPAAPAPAAPPSPAPAPTAQVAQVTTSDGFGPAEEAIRLRASFLTNVTHELRTPLISIVGFAELLHEQGMGPIDPAYRPWIDDMLTSAHHLQRVIGDILDLAQVEAGQLEFRPDWFAPGTVALQVRDMIRETATQRGVAVEVEVDPALGDVRIDPDRFRQVLTNYLSNAIKFSPGGSTVQVRIREERDGWFRVEVEDAGPGIATADLPRLFVEFQRLGPTPQRTTGTGLGLALTRRLVEAQGGRVGARRAPGGGAVFFAVLPKRPRHLTGPQRVYPPSGSARILVVEPDPDQATRVLRALREWGMEGCLADCGEAALEEAQRTSFGGLLLTLALPDMSGLDLLRTIRHQGLQGHAPALIASPQGTPVASEHGAHAIIAHPIRPDQLFAALRRARLAAGTEGHGIPAPPRVQGP